MKKFLFIGLTIFVVLVGCDLTNRDFYRTADDFPENGKGMLVLIFDNSVIKSQTIDPTDPNQGGDPTILAPYTYQNLVATKASGPGSYSEADPTLNITGNVYTKNGLDPGEYTITLQVWNQQSTPKQIGHGTITVNVVPNVITSVNFPLLPETGNGDLQLKISWPADSIPNPLVEAWVVDPNGNEEEISSDLSSGTHFVVDASSGDFATYPASGFISKAAGYHTFRFQLFDYDGTTKTLVTGDSASIRIITGYQTTGNWVITDSGDLKLTLEYNPKDPFVVTISAPVYVDTAGSEQLTATASFTAPNPAPVLDPAYTYEWYVDGASVAGPTDSNITSNDLIANGDIPGGNHKLSAVVTAHFGDAYGDIVSSQTASFTTP